MVTIEVEGIGAHVLPKGQGSYRAVVMNDIHFPYEDPKALALAEAVTKLARPDVVIWNGDIWDAYEVAPWQVRPRRRVEFARVRDIVRQKVQALASWTKVPIVYIEGNHERRITSYLWRRAGELAELEELTIPALLGLGDRVTYLPHGEDYQSYGSSPQPEVWLGKLSVCHGDMLRLSVNARHVAMLAAQRMGEPIMLGHYHVQQHVQLTGYDGRAIGAWAVGCLCLPKPHYAASRVGTHGMAVVEVDSNGHFAVEPVVILTLHGEARYRGKTIRI